MVIALATGVGLLCWPQRQGVGSFPGKPAWPHTLRRVTRPGAGRARWVAMAICMAVAAIGALGGVVVAVAGALLLSTVSLLVGSDMKRRRYRRELADLLAAVRTLAREVRAGAQPLAAITASARAHTGSASGVLEDLARAVAGDRGGGPVADTTETGAARTGAVRTGAARRDIAGEVGGRLAAGWALSARYGVAWAALIDALAVDLDHQVRTDALREAQVSGPRVSGFVLALMPALGLLLGVGMGADPIHILLETGAGHLLLLVGSALSCAGLWWTARIVRG